MPEKHPVTEAMRQVTLRALRTKGITKTELAKATGYGSPWVTKFLNGSIRTIDLEAMHAIEKLLGISYFSAERAGGNRSAFASRVATMVDTDPKFAKVIGAIESILTDRSAPLTPRFIDTKDMTRIGQEIIKIAFANEDKPGKVAREVLKLLA